MLFQDVVFWILAVVAIGSALGVVLVRDLFRAALLLAMTFIAVAGFFVLLSAEFLAVVQVLIYVGAISILFIFGIMLTRDVTRGNLPNRLQIPAVLFPALLLVALISVALSADWRLLSPSEEQQAGLVQVQAVGIPRGEVAGQAGSARLSDGDQAQTAGLADLLIGKFVLPFEAVSLLLLAALIGALALARPQRRA